jgi:hypothetical protein
MDLFVSDITLREIAGYQSTFPESIREMICRSVQQIPIEDIESLLGKHEADASNFDRRIEGHLRNALPSNFKIQANHRVAKVTQYNSDIVIDTPSVSICIEIEKGYMSRFELDILKMQVHASSLLEKDIRTIVYGVFIVPADNVVAGHITGNSRESSFKYLTRLSRLVANISPMLLQDILIVGYSMTPLEVKIKTAKGRKPKRAKESGDQSLVNGGTGLVDVDQIRQKLKSYPLELVLQLREKLISAFPKLREKLNPRSRYLGYSNGDHSDAVYVYLQKKRLLLDIRVSGEEAENLRMQGIKVVPRNNFQCRAGWLTGVSVPYDTDKLDIIIDLVSSALTE